MRVAFVANCVEASAGDIAHSDVIHFAPGYRVDDFDRAGATGDRPFELNVARVGECRAAQAQGQGRGYQ
ncbi:hypothetical protein D3C75_1263420 [compost metagenome]